MMTHDRIFKLIRCFPIPLAYVAGFALAVAFGLPRVAGASQSATEEGQLEISDVQLTLITRVRVAAPEPGRVRELLCQAGDLVQEDASLVQLDDHILAGAAEAAALEARVAAIESENDVDLRFAEKSALVARAELHRSQEAIHTFPKSISRSELDQLRLMLDRAELSAEQASRLLQMKELTAMLRAKQAEVLADRVALMHVRSPIDGMVVETLVQAGDWANAGEPLVRVIQLDRLRVEAFVDGTRYDQKALANAPLKLYVTLPSDEKETEFAGTVTFVSPEVSPVNDEIRIWADIANPDLLLRPGLRGRLVVQLNSEQGE